MPIKAESRTLDFGLQCMCCFQNRMSLLAAKSLAQNQNINLMVHQHERSVRQTVRCKYRVTCLYKYHSPRRSQHLIVPVDQNSAVHDCSLREGFELCVSKNNQIPRIASVTYSANFTFNCCNLTIATRFEQTAYAMLA